MELFCSRDERYRTPFGAVEQETTVLFRICLPRDWQCHAAWLIHTPDAGKEAWDGMFWAGMEGNDREWWDCRFAPPVPDLYWYCFAVDTAFGRRFLACRPDGTAEVREQKDGAPWQLTCYEHGFVTPDWPAGGTMYQIFPDRFARSPQYSHAMPRDREWRENWGETPRWRPDETGTVRNNDFFGGNLAGIREKLPHLKQLGVTAVYLNPIFEAQSNHRYDTADYRRIDVLLGDEDEFRALTAAAEACGIRIILDGVFSHTGADSVYFNRYGRYAEDGAFQSCGSPYFSWYNFRHWPQDYAAWWGFPTLPEVNELDEGFLRFITGQGGIAEHWLQAGAGGWRLDVADELPDGFLEALRRRVKETDGQALLLGEVWEDASNKQSYGHRRRYLLGRQLDSVMNYPFRQAVVDFVRGGNTADFFNTVMAVVENYPPQVTRLLMNSLGTHDTARILTVLGGEAPAGRGRSWQAEQHLSPSEREHGIRLLKIASAVQYCLPGIPCLYYGDEAGMEGYGDPFNRGCYPWGNENAELLAWFERLGSVRASQSAFAAGTFRPIPSPEGTLCFERGFGDEAVLCAVNRLDHEIHLPLPSSAYRCRMEIGTVKEGFLRLPAFTAEILTKS